MSAFNFTTLADVEPHLDGVAEWEWGPNTSFENFCVWVWTNHDGYAETCQNIQRCHMLFDYITQMGEDPADYNISKGDFEAKPNPNPNPPCIKCGNPTTDGTHDCGCSNIPWE